MLYFQAYCVVSYISVVQTKLIDTYYEYGLTAFKNGDVVNNAGENEGTAKILSYAALSRLSKESTLKVGLLCFLFQ